MISADLGASSATRLKLSAPVNFLLIRRAILLDQFMLMRHGLLFDGVDPLLWRDPFKMVRRADLHRLPRKVREWSAVCSSIDETNYDGPMMRA